MRVFWTVLLCLLISAQLFLSGCSRKEETSAAPAGSEVTAAPIYSNNVPMEYLIMANQGQALFASHTSLSLQVDHLLYGRYDVWFDAEGYYRAEDSGSEYFPGSDRHWSAFRNEKEEAVRYRVTDDSKGLFAGDDFQLIEPKGSEEEIQTEAEYNGAFHVITERPIGEDLEYYSMLHATATDRIREEYILDSATLALLVNETSLIRSDGSEEKIGTMTVSYDTPLPEDAAGLKDLLTKAKTSSPALEISLRDIPDGDRTIHVAEGTRLEILPGSGTQLTIAGKNEPYQGVQSIHEPLTLNVS